MDAVTAERIGFVSRVVPEDQLEQAATELTQEMLNATPIAFDGFNINSLYLCCLPKAEAEQIQETPVEKGNWSDITVGTIVCWRMSVA